MSDLNDWVLTSGSESISFGTQDSDYPFDVQVQQSSVSRAVSDQARSGVDGLSMGRDFLQGFTLAFKGKILPEFPRPNKPWQNSLDLYNDFASVWDAEDVRQTAGAYATLDNLDRQRRVYGRPRDIAPDYAGVRKGLLPFQMDFDTITPYYYDTIEKSRVLTTLAPPSTDTFTDPLRDPIRTTAVNGPVSATSQNSGNREAEPIIEFRGPGSQYSLDLINGEGDALWSLQIVGKLAFDQMLTVDARTWRMTATMNGSPANGRLRGSRLVDCKIPRGSFDLVYRVNDPTGQSSATVRWRDTYVGL